MILFLLLINYYKYLLIYCSCVLLSQAQLKYWWVSLLSILISLDFKSKELARMGGSLLSKAEVSGSSLLGHLPKEFSLRLTWCPWLVGYYSTRGISRGARKLARTPSLSKKKNLSISSPTCHQLKQNIINFTVKHSKDFLILLFLCDRVHFHFFFLSFFFWLILMIFC